MKRTDTRSKVASNPPAATKLRSPPPPHQPEPWVHKTSWPRPSGSPASVYEKSREQRGGKGAENATACRRSDSSLRDPVCVARLSERD